MRAFTGKMARIVIAAVLIAGISVSRGSADDSAAVVTRLDGSATVFARGAKIGKPLKKNNKITKGQEVKVGERSRLELKYPDGTVMRFAERSVIKMDDISYDSKTQNKKVRVDLGGGKLWANVTVYRVNVDEDNSAMVKVYDGSVNVTGVSKEQPKTPGQVTAPVPVPGPHEVPPPYHEVSMEEWTVIVKAMQQISISPQGVASEPQDFTPQQDMDDWVKWNQERDKQLDQ